MEKSPKITTNIPYAISLVLVLLALLALLAREIFCESRLPPFLGIAPTGSKK